MNENPGQYLGTEKNISKQDNIEVDLILRIVHGDEIALEQLYHDYYSRLLRFITRIAGQTDHVDEIINDVMFVVWKKASTYNQSCRPSTWIFGIAYNKTRKSIQKSGLGITESLDAMDSENQLFGLEDTELQLLEIRNWLENAFAVLSSEQRTVVELTYFHGMHYSEIAELMMCPQNTVKTRMHHARKKLAPILLRLKNTP